MIRLIPLLLLSLGVMWNPALAEQIVELDLDGVMGNGPDTVEVEAGDLLSVDVWFRGEPALLAWWVTICHPDGGLVLCDYEDYIPDSWTLTPLHAPFPDCDAAGATNFNFDCLVMWQPTRVLTIVYQAGSAGGPTSLVVDELESGWLDPCVSDQLDWATVDDVIGATVLVGTTDTESPNWGSVKKLFR